jgi:hypothetical protein
MDFRGFEDADPAPGAPPIAWRCHDFRPEHDGVSLIFIRTSSSPVGALPSGYVKWLRLDLNERAGRTINPRAWLTF